MKNVIISQVKNQEDRIHDWMFYHYHEGFDTFIFFDDFSKDNTALEIREFEKKFPVNVRLYFTDGKGKNYTIEDSRNSEIYLHDTGLHERIARSYKTGNDIVKQINPDAICSFLDVDEFLVTNQDRKVTDIVSEIFNDGEYTQLYIYNFDIRNDFKLEKKLIYENENYYRWDFEDVNNHYTYRNRKKCITISKSTEIVKNMHEINERSDKDYYIRDYNVLRLHHFRIPNLKNDTNIKFVLDNTVKNKMLNFLRK